MVHTSREGKFVYSTYVTTNEKAVNVIAAYPVGGGIKVNPWNDQLRMLKQPVGILAEDEIS